MLQYFPFASDTFGHTMGVAPLGERPLIEIDQSRYATELAHKRALLRSDARYYAQALGGTEALQSEALAVVLRDLAQHNPAAFQLRCAGQRWQWRNTLLHSEHEFSYGDGETLPNPLVWLGQQVQEDLLILSGDQETGFPLVAGVLCFANLWCLDDKLGLPFAAIHSPVPAFGEQLGKPAHLLLARLKAERPVWRINWSITSNNWLDLAPRHAEANNQTKQGVTAVNAGEHCWLRTERQCLVRLPESNAILFTIHTHCTALAAVAADPLRARRLLGVLQSAPAATLEYKGIAPFAAPLCSYLATTAAPAAITN